MRNIPRYQLDWKNEELEVSNDAGTMCFWRDVEPLVKELQEMTAKAVAAVWLVPEGTAARELHDLYQEAQRVLNGDDKERIKELVKELDYLKEAYRNVQRPPQAPGVHSVYAKKGSHDIPLQLCSIIRHTNGGLVIGVYLP